MSDPRFPQGPEWRFAVLDRSSFATLTILDAVAFSRGVQLLLNAPATATGTVPSDDPEVNLAHTDGDPFVEEGTRILYGFRREGGSPPWVPRFAGVILQLEDTTDGDRAVSHYTAFDARQGLYQRPCRDFDGALPGANGISFSETDIDAIIGFFLANTIAEDGPCMIDAGEAYGGTAFYAGTIETVDGTGKSFNFPKGTSVGEAWTQLTNAGLCDIVLTPIYDPDDRPGYTHELNIYVQAGTDQSGAIFRHGDNCRLQRLVDGTQRANRIYAFAGTARALTDDSPHIDAAAETKYGTQIVQGFYPGQNDGGAVDALVQRQLELRANGRTTIKVTPLPELAPLPFSDYNLGDRLPVWADSSFRKPIVGNDVDSYLRVYGIPIDIGDDALETVSELLAFAG